MKPTNTLTDDQAWFILYQALVTMDNHPGNKTPKTANYLAVQADHYFTEFRRRFPCQHSSQAQ